MFESLPPGPRDKFPDEIFVVVEVPRGTSNKYEYDTEIGVIILNRALHTSTIYPGDYGFIPKTIAEDGDPIDVLIITHTPTFPYCVVPSIPIGVLKQVDENGADHKVIAVPSREPRFASIREITDLNENILKEIKHFFMHYKDLEEGKWVRILGWGNSIEAKKLIIDAHRKYLEANKS